MTPPRIERRIFVVGVPRSGTTLVQSLLGSHSSLTSFTESHFLSRHYKLLPAGAPPLMTRDPEPRLEAFLTENDAPTEVRRESLRRLSGAGRRSILGGRAAARVFVETLDDLALARGASGWIEKTPAHLRYLPLLESVIDTRPKPLFVHVVRRGPQVVASLHRASRDWEEAYDLRTCAARWNGDVRFSLERFGSPSDHFVFYEELVADPPATARRLVEALGLPWEEEILERYGEVASDVTTSAEGWKADVGREIRPSSASGLSAEEAERVQSWLDDSLYDRLRERVGGAAG